MTFNTGDVIGGRYKIHRIAGGSGRSGMGTVYICHDHKAGGVLALKTYQQGFFHDKALVEHFKRGALAWIKLDHHPYIVQALGVFKLADRLFLGLEYIAPDDENRTTLTHYLQSHVSLKQTLTWAIEFCDAMEHARQRGITPHRDLKPDNIMITREGTLKVSDFDLSGTWTDISLPVGLDQQSISNTPGLTFIKIGEGNYVVGTPPWMAPEQFDGNTSVQSDIYSFGIILYQLVSGGQLPYRPGTDGSWEQVHKTATPARLETPLWSLIEQCLAKQPGDRFGGQQADQGFNKIREALTILWQKCLPDTEIPSPPTGNLLGAEDHNVRGASLAELGLYDQAIIEYKKALKLKPDFAQAYLNAAVSMSKRGDNSNAIKALKKAIQLKPDLAEAYNNYGAICQELGKLEEAEKAYRKVIQMDPYLIGSLRNLGVLLSKTNRHDEAIELMQKALERDPANPDYHYSLGVSYEKAERFQEALPCFQEAVRLRPDSAKYHYGLGNAWRYLGDMDQAVSSWQKTALLDSGDVMCRYNLGIAFERSGQVRTAYGYYREAINCNPAVPDPYYNIGLMLAKNKLYGEGADAFEKFLEYITPDLLEHSDKAKSYVESMRRDETEYQQLMHDHPEAVYDRGNAYLNLGRYEDAREYFELALKKRPEYNHALTGLGVYYDRTNRPDEAIKCYQRCIASDPDYALAWNNLGWVNYQSGNLDEALKAYSQYIQKAPKEQLQWIQDAKNIIADIREKKKMNQANQRPVARNTTSQGQPVQETNNPAAQINDILKAFVDGGAEQGWAKMAEAVDNSDSPEVHMQMGDQYFDDKKYDLALDEFFRVLELDPDNVLAMTRIGQVFLDKQEFDAAKGQFDDLMEQYPQEAAFPYNLGNVFHAMGKDREAIKAYEKALKLNPKMAAAHINIGGVLSEQGKNKPAMKAYQKALKINPKSALAHFNLATIHQKMKNNKLAVQSYREFLKYADPGLKDAIESAKKAITDLGGSL